MRVNRDKGRGDHSPSHQSQFKRPCPFRESKGARTSEASVRGMPAGANLVVAPATATKIPQSLNPRNPRFRQHPSQFIISNHRNHSSKTPLTMQTSVVLSESDRRIDTVLRRRVQTPDPSGRRDTYVRKPRQNGNESAAIHRAESQRLHDLWRRPSSDRKSGARPGGPCRSVGGRVPGARRISPASHSEPAGIVRSKRTMPSQGPGDPRGADIRLLLSAAGGRLQRERSPKS